VLFNSLEFLIFFPAVTILFFILPHRYRWFMLLVASCVFYMAFIPVYVCVLFLTIFIDYFAGIFIENTHGIKRKLYLVVSIISTCAVLFVFKYYNFFAANVAMLCDLLNLPHPVHPLSLILPIGLSFHTFQSLSYVIEVYRGQQKAEKKFGIYALYVMFYPQLVAGPIERPQNLLHQFYEKHTLDYVRITDGLKLILWGFFKKIVIADRLAIYVSAIYDHPGEYHGLPVILATYFFAFQIYCDFSGYSDIAIGCAKVMGFDLMQNFNRPYFSKSISEFWHRWHISLSTWFRDYLYIPMGGNRVGKTRWYANIFLVFLISGFWHGANWTFVVWGALHGFYLLFSIWTQEIRSMLADACRLRTFPRIEKCVRILMTFHLVLFSWVFFRARSISDALTIFHDMFCFDFSGLGINVAEFGRYELMVAFFSISIMELVHFAQRNTRILEVLSQKPIWLRWAVYYGVLFGILMFGEFKISPFIYFQF